MSEIKLLPCPFCGGEAVQCFSINAETYRYGCMTSGCPSNVHTQLKGYKTDKEAIEHWNTRKPMERIIERLKGKKKTLCGTYDFYTKPLDRPSCKIAFNNGICESIEVIKEEGGIE